MTTKLLALVHSKVTLAVLGVLLVSGSGAAVVAATHGQVPATHASAQATHTPAADSGNHGHTVSLEGKLTAYRASAKTISVQTEDATNPTTVGVDANTRVNGEHASSLSDLTNAVGHDVQVQATKQSNGSLLAWKITVQGSDSSHGDGGGNGNADGQQHTLTGTIASLGTNSFTLTLPDGTTKTVTVSATTQFKGAAHRFADLARGMHVAVTGTDQSNGTVAATQIEAGGS
jgi:Domain of unknown function (DUF5666)